MLIDGKIPTWQNADTVNKGRPGWDQAKARSVGLLLLRTSSVFLTVLRRVLGL